MFLFHAYEFNKHLLILTIGFLPVFFFETFSDFYFF